jgi:uncharacterized membrane protein
MAGFVGGNNDKSAIFKAMWILTAVSFVSMLTSMFIPDTSSTFLYLLTFLSNFCLLFTALIHCIKFYGIKNTIALFILSWVISNFFETLSIAVGFPFGNYHYTDSLGIKFLNVPIIIMPAYFSMGYISWIITHILVGQYSRKPEGIQIFLTPFIASFIMVMWDVVMDPIMSTLDKNWIWEEGGSYYGVPITNYLGWFFVVFIFLQVFAIIISKTYKEATNLSAKKSFWVIPVFGYAIIWLRYILTALIKETNNEIYSSMGLVSVFTMCFVVVLSIVTIIYAGKNKTYYKK